MPAKSSVPRGFAPWVQPLAEFTYPVLTPFHPGLCTDALLAVGAAYAHVSEQSLAEFLRCGKDTWDRCWNLPAVHSDKHPWTYVFPPKGEFSPNAEDLAHLIVVAITDRREKWAAVGSAWAGEIASSQVGAFAILLAARVLQPTRTGYSRWRQALEDAWNTNPFEVEVVPAASEEAPDASAT